MSKPIITIGGLPGSGKSTIADRVAAELGWSRFSSGDFMREIAHERGITLSKLLQEAEKNPEIDRTIDARNKSLADAENVIIDSRLAWHFIPKSFAVYLAVDLAEGARRIHADNKETRIKSGENHDVIEKTAREMQERIDGEKRRYKKLYDIDHTDPDNYDLVIDTTNKGIEKITKEVIDAYQQWRD
ncbi:MAG: cytidylate kinase family protein [Candidatus Paceibacterota bacterium]